MSEMPNEVNSGKFMNSFALISMLLISACSQLDKNGQYKLPIGLDEAINSPARAEENTDRDQYQHPKETLKFFGIRSTMTVVEISPGNGYFTEILAPYLSKTGRLILAVPRLPRHPPAVLIESEKKLQEILLRHKEVHSKTSLMPFEPIDKRNRIKKEFVDMVVSFNHVHNWVAKKETKASFKLIHDILKPHGILGIVQHRIHAGKKRVSMSGYMYEKEVIDLARAAGFKLIQKSEINANPKDTADYPGGVWTLPPVYRLGKKDRDKYEEIGESDRMTLRFVKVK